MTVESGKTVAQRITLRPIQIYTTSCTLSGTVIDKDTAEPLSGATVSIEGTSWSATTKDDGSYSIYEIEAGTYEVTASKTGYISRTETVTIEGDITKDFELLALVQLVQYDLTIECTVGVSVIAPGEGTFTYDAVTVVDLVAIPEDGYRFVKWIGDVGTVANVTAAETTITMHGNYCITASAVAVYDLTISGTEGGSVTIPGEGTFTYDAETVVNLVAIPDDGYRFVEWTGDVGTVANATAAQTIITVSGNYSIMATFAIEPIEATEVRVDSITYQPFGNGQQLNIFVTLLNDLGKPVAYANVSATLYWDNGASWSFQGTTKSDGTVTFKLHKNNPNGGYSSGCYQTEITDVQANGLEWDGVTPENGHCKQ